MQLLNCWNLGRIRPGSPRRSFKPDPSAKIGDLLTKIGAHLTGMRQFAKNQPAVWVFSAALVLLFLTATVSEKIASSYRKSADQVTHTREVDVHLARARAALARTEAALMKGVSSGNRGSQTYDTPLRDA